MGCYKHNPGDMVHCDIHDDVGYVNRIDAIGQCERCAKLKVHRYFALQDGGACYSINTNRYTSQGRSNRCIDDGKGGPNSNFVYERKCKYRFCITLSISLTS